MWIVIHIIEPFVITLPFQMIPVGLLTYMAQGLFSRLALEWRSLNCITRLQLKHSITLFPHLILIMSSCVCNYLLCTVKAPPLNLINVRRHMLCHHPSWLVRMDILLEQAHIFMILALPLKSSYYFDGPTLDHILAQTPLPSKEALQSY